MATRGQIHGKVRGGNAIALLFKKHPDCEQVFRDFVGMRDSMGGFLERRIQPQFVKPDDWFVKHLRWLVKLIQHTAQTGDSVELERFAIAFGQYCQPDREAEIKSRVWLLLERPNKTADIPLWKKQGRSFSHAPMRPADLYRAVCGAQQQCVRYSAEKPEGEVIDGGPAIDISKTQFRRLLKEWGVTWIEGKSPAKSIKKVAKRSSGKG